MNVRCTKAAAQQWPTCSKSAKGPSWRAAWVIARKCCGAVEVGSEPKLTDASALTFRREGREEGIRGDREYSSASDQPDIRKNEMRRGIARDLKHKKDRIASF